MSAKLRRQKGSRDGSELLSNGAAQRSKSDESFDQDGISYEKGDHILLRNPGAKTLPYIARIIAVHKHGTDVSIRVQWYYRRSDIAGKHRRSAPFKLAPHEILATCHEDFNSTESIVGKCHVTTVKIIPPSYQVLTFPKNTIMMMLRISLAES
jgi:hypothetical protein